MKAEITMMRAFRRLGLIAENESIPANGLKGPQHRPWASVFAAAQNMYCYEMTTKFDDEELDVFLSGDSAWSEQIHDLLKRFGHIWTIGEERIALPGCRLNIDDAGDRQLYA
jgi:hypothetical protein